MNRARIGKLLSFASVAILSTMALVSFFGPSGGFSLTPDLITFVIAWLFLLGVPVFSGLSYILVNNPRWRALNVLCIIVWLASMNYARNMHFIPFPSISASPSIIESNDPAFQSMLIIEKATWKACIQKNMKTGKNHIQTHYTCGPVAFRVTVPAVTSSPPEGYYYSVLLTLPFDTNKEKKVWKAQTENSYPGADNYYTQWRNSMLLIANRLASKKCMTDNIPIEDGSSTVYSYKCGTSVFVNERVTIQPLKGITKKNRLAYRPHWPTKEQS